MSINIPVAICRVAASVMVNVDTMKLGPQVYKKLLESIRTGEIAAGMGGDLALAHRRQSGLPYLRVERERRIDWEGLEPDSLAFKKLETVCAAIELMVDGKEYEWQKEGLAEFRRAVYEQQSHYNAWMYASISPKLLTNLGLPRFEGEIPRILTMEMLPTEGEVK